MKTCSKCKEEKPLNEFSIFIDDLNDEDKIELDKCLSQSESLVISKTYLKIIKSKKDTIKYIPYI